jgi:hypothetical protein
MLTIGTMVLTAALATTAVQTPGPSPEMKKLEAYNGEWVGKAKNYMEPGAPPVLNDCTVQVEFVMGGMYQRIKYDTEVPGMGKLDGLILTGYDAAKKVYRSWNYNNFVPTPVVESAVFEGDVMVGKSEVMDMGMGPMTQFSRSWMKGKNELFLKVEAEIGGQRMTLVELELKRK